MSKVKKLHYYVLVMTNDGPMFVTRTEYHDAYWNYKEKPMEFDKTWAEEIARGLSLNWHLAYVVAQPWEIDSQPYRYSDYKIEWKEREKEEEEKDAESD